MTVRIGLIGVGLIGLIGQDHLRRLTRVLAGAQVVALCDVGPAKAQDVASRFTGPSPIRVHASGQEVIADAVVVCSWGPTHEEYVLASIAAGKPVFCEKPLAETPEACQRKWTP